MFGLLMTLSLSSCCSVPEPKPVVPEIIEVDRTAIAQNEDGTFTVTKEWMLYRMNLERRLGEKLLMCQEAQK